MMPRVASRTRPRRFGPPEACDDRRQSTVSVDNTETTMAPAGAGPQADVDATGATPPPSTPAAPAPPGRVARWLPAAAVLAVLLVILLATGTSPLDVARYGAYTVWAVLLPGVLVYRVLRATPHSLLDDLAMGAAVGLALEIGAYLLASAAGARWALPLWPLLVVVPFAAAPRLRRHLRPGGYRPVPLAWSWSVAAVAVVLLTYLAFAFLAPNQPVPTRAPQRYFIDELYFLSLVGDAMHHFPPQVPSVAGEPLAYHWFSFAHMAVGSLISGVDPAVVVFRLDLPLVSLLSVLLLAVAGWRVSGRAWVGPVAAALMFAIGELTVGSYAPSPIGAVTAFVIWASLSLGYGTVFTIALIPAIVDRLGGLREAYGRGGWPLLALFALVAPGAKSTVIPVTLCGLGLVAAVQLVRRRLTPAPWLAIGVLLAAQLLGTALLYRFESQGVQVQPLAMLERYLHAMAGRPWWQDLVVLGYVLGGYALYMLPRLAGIPVLAWLRRGGWGGTGWFLLGGIAGGTALTLLLAHIAGSQNFFIRTGWPFGAILSAMGLVELVRRRRLTATTVAVTAAAVLAAAALVSLVLSRFPLPRGTGGFRMFLPVYRLAAVVAVLAVLAFVALRLAGPRLRPVAAVAVLMLLLGAGAPGLAWDAYKYPNDRNYYHSTVTPSQAAALRWLRAHSDPADLVATNSHCARPGVQPCLTLSFWVSAFSERRVLVEGWGYTAHSVRDSMRSGLAQGLAPFWDPAMLAANDAAITAPTASGTAWLRARGVRWVVVDRRLGREPPALAGLAALRVDAADIAVYQLSAG
jgi:hypothetical protein